MSHKIAGAASSDSLSASLSSPLEVRLGDDSTQYAEGFGLLQIHLPNGQNTIIDRVYYVPVSIEDAFTHSELQQDQGTDCRWNCASKNCCNFWKGLAFSFEF